MENQEKNNSIETPQSFREVALQLQAITETIRRQEAVQAQRHKENIESIQKLTDQTPTRIEFDEYKKQIKDITDDHETRIRRGELWGTLLVGGLYVINIIIGYYIIYYH